MKLSDIKRVRQAVEHGAWIGDFEITGMEGLRLNVRGLGNSDYNRLYADLAAALPAEKRTADGMPALEADKERIFVECLKRTVLIGWEGIDDKFTAKAVDQVFADKDLGPAFRAAVLYAASSVGKNARNALETAAKN